MPILVYDYKPIRNLIKQWYTLDPQEELWFIRETILNTLSVPVENHYKALGAWVVPELKQSVESHIWQVLYNHLNVHALDTSEEVSVRIVGTELYIRGSRG